ncbi:uracil permease [Ruminococcus sp. YE71]|uniref:uracil-xanthine permease family protein n=1 Tax=unclassified Ruminococcus TaxID=2608920 RepID=UPI000884ACB4|nr:MULTISPECIES: solute carrier family 23 protein [unclassified Ruminococcus]SDA17455.1 uracil permease [Ruminococcus sp. YE78]SFW26872.1 uracil permease [Ruminococcus sp. YE71]
MELIYDVGDKPKGLSLIAFALQQMLAILAATIAVPVIIGNGLTPAAAMFGAGVGTIVYLLFTQRKSPVFLGSSFAFIGSMSAAFAGSVSMAQGMAGLILGAICAGLVYVLLAVLIKVVGVDWINKLMPPVVIGPTVAIIGLSLSSNAIGDLRSSDVVELQGTNYAAIVCGIITLFVTMICTVYGKKMLKLIPFIIGILAGYAAAAVMTAIGNSAGIDALKIIDFSVFERYMFADGVSLSTFLRMPDLVVIKAADGLGDIDSSYFLTILVAYTPVAFVVFAEHIADHKNLSSVIGRDLLTDPGLSRTLLGDGVGSMFGAVFGGCPNTTYGESVGCVAITRNASVITIITAAIGCILLSFITPFVAFIDSIPSCVMGGVCVALYGFIAVSGLKMLGKVDFDNDRNLFTASVILIAGIGGLSLNFGAVTLTEIATALILGMIVNLLLSAKKGGSEPQK